VSININVEGERSMNTIRHNKEVCELTECELNKVSGGETVHSTDYTLTQTLCTWYLCMGLMGAGIESGANGPPTKV
jgi:bacteriocin-like protein